MFIAQTSIEYYGVSLELCHCVEIYIQARNGSNFIHCPTVGCTILLTVGSLFQLILPYISGISRYSSSILRSFFIILPGKLYPLKYVL